MDKEKLTEKISSLIKDPNFVLKLSKTKSDEEAVKLFADNGCELAADKVKFVRDTLNSLLKGDIEISEDDLENVSGGRIDTTKVVAVALAATIVIGGSAWALSGSKETPQQPQESAFSTGAKAAGKVAAQVGSSMARVAAQPTYWQSFKGLFSKNQRMYNAGMEAAGNAAADVLAGV